MAHDELLVQTPKYIEDPIDYKARKISHYVIYFTITSSSLFYSALLVSLWPYLNKLDSECDKNFFGYLAAVGAIATTLFCPLFGKWSNSLKSCKTPFLITLVCGLINYGIYVSLPFFDKSHRRYWFMVARFMTGMNDINIGLSRGYIADSTLKTERRQAVSTLTGCQTIAFAIGPVLQSLMVTLGENGFTFWFVRIDMYTAIGWMGLLTTFLNILLFLSPIFKHCDVRHLDKSTSNSLSINKYYKLIAWIFILLQFLLICNYLYLKVLGTPLVMDEYGLSRPEAIKLNSYILFGGAIVSLIAIWLMDYVCQKCGELNTMYIGFLIIIIGRFLMYPIGSNKLLTTDKQDDLGCPQWSQKWCIDEKQMSLVNFIASNILDNFGYTWAITIIYTQFSRVLGTKQQGTWMGLMTSLSGFARIVSPIVLSYLYVLYGNSILILITNFVYIASTIFTCWLIVYWTTKGTRKDVSIEDADNILIK